MPMSEEPAAWVRAYVWTDRMRDLETNRPGYWAKCECERDLCHQCKRGVHDDCSGGREHTSREGMVADRSGVDFVEFAEPYKHVTKDGPPRPTPVAQFWLADRVCSWSCRCECREPGRRPMTRQEASWVRVHVWTATMRKTHREVPGFRTSCSCEYGASQHCQDGKHGRCGTGEGVPHCETYVTDRREFVLYLPEEFGNPAVSATGAHSTGAAMVWLADRVCRWVCPCSCHRLGAVVPPPKARAMSWLGEPATQETLF